MNRFSISLLLLTLISMPAMAQSAASGGDPAEEVRRDVRDFLSHVVKKLGAMSDSEAQSVFTCPDAGVYAQDLYPEPGKFHGKEKIRKRVEAIVVSTVKPRSPEAARHSVVIERALVSEHVSEELASKFEEGSLLSVDPTAFGGLVESKKITPVLSMMVLQAVCRDDNAHRLTEADAEKLAAALMK